MVRFVIIFFLMFYYSAGARAAGASPACYFDNLYSRSVMTGDFASAKLHEVVGYFEYGWTVSNCDNVPGAPYGSAAYVGYYGPGGIGDPYCTSTISGIYLDVSPSYCRVDAPFGSMTTVIRIDQPFPQSGYIRKNFVRNQYQLSAPGNYKLGPKLNTLYLGWYRGTTTPTNPYLHVLLHAGDEGPAIITTCSLVNTDILVNFGEVSEANASEPFDIEFSGCTNQADTKRFNDSVSLSFVSDDIRADGSALLNKSCANCAKGLQIALKDGKGTPINLSKSYKLSSNGSSTISPTGLKYGFIADLQRNPDQALSGGNINTNLTFVTSIE